MGSVNVNHTPACNGCLDLNTIFDGCTSDTPIECIVNRMEKDEAHTTVKPLSRFVGRYPVDGTLSLDINTKSINNTKMRIVNIVSENCEAYTNVFKYIWNDMSTYCIGKVARHKVIHVITTPLVANSYYYFNTTLGYCVFKGVASDTSGRYISVNIKKGDSSVTVNSYNVSTPNDIETRPGTIYAALPAIECTELQVTTHEVRRYGMKDILNITDEPEAYDAGGNTGDALRIKESDLMWLVDHYTGKQYMDDDCLSGASCTTGKPEVTILDIIVMMRYLYYHLNDTDINNTPLQTIMRALSINEDFIMPQYGALYSLIKYAANNQPIPSFSYLTDECPKEFKPVTTSYAIGDTVIFTYDGELYSFISPTNIYSNQIITPTSQEISSYILLYVNGTGVTGHYCRLFDYHGEVKEYVLPVTKVTEGVSTGTATELSMLQAAYVVAMNGYKWLSSNGWNSSCLPTSSDIVTMTSDRYEQITPKDNTYYNVLYPCGDTLTYRGNRCINCNIRNFGEAPKDSNNNYVYTTRTNLAVPASIYIPMGFDTPQAFHKPFNAVDSIEKFEFRGLTAIDFSNKYTYEFPSYLGCISINSYLSKVNMSNRTTVVSDYAFNVVDMTRLNYKSDLNVNRAVINYVPSSPITVGKCAFAGCVGITNSSLPTSAISVDVCGFYGCTSITSADFSVNNTTFAESAFENCTGLTTVTLPVASSLPANLFAGCTHLSNIYYAGTTSQWNSLTKDSTWRSFVPATVVHCSNGDVNLV